MFLVEELETKYAVEMMEVRENIDEKAAKIKTALKKAELEVREILVQ